MRGKDGRKSRKYQSLFFMFTCATALVHVQRTFVVSFGVEESEAAAVDVRQALPGTLRVDGVCRDAYFSGVNLPCQDLKNLQVFSPKQEFLDRHVEIVPAKQPSNSGQTAVTPSSFAPWHMPRPCVRCARWVRGSEQNQNNHPFGRCATPCHVQGPACAVVDHAGRAGAGRGRRAGRGCG